MCGSGAPGTSICGGCEEEEEVISAAFCLKREKGLAGLPPVPRGAAPPSAVALLREVKGRKETMFSKEDEGGEEEEEKRSVLEGLRSTVRKKKKSNQTHRSTNSTSFNARPAHSRAPHELLLVSLTPELPLRIAAKESRRGKGKRLKETEKRDKATLFSISLSSMPSTTTSSAAATAASAAASADLASALAALRSAGALLVEQARAKQQQQESKSTSSAQSSRQLATAGALALLRLKAALRTAAEAADLARAGASSARAEADAAALAVASLAYEARHYDREIQAARDYESSFSEEEIDLVSLEEFWATAPAELRDKAAKAGEEGREEEAAKEKSSDRATAAPASQKHALTLARLEHERASRVRGAAEARDAKAACEAAEADAAQARLELAELGERVSAVVAALEAAVPPLAVGAVGADAS
jgi:hypothetical protein